MDILVTDDEEEIDGLEVVDGCRVDVGGVEFVEVVHHIHRVALDNHQLGIRNNALAVDYFEDGCAHLGVVGLTGGAPTAYYQDSHFFFY